MRGTRTQGRAFALQLLYQIEISGTPGTRAEEMCWQEQPPQGEALQYANILMEATGTSVEEIDARLRQNLEHWKLERLSVVVRNLLRMAVCEMIVLGEVPFQVVINEAVELAHDFADQDSAKFTNSVLEKCWVNSGGRADRNPA